MSGLNRTPARRRLVSAAIAAALYAASAIVVPMVHAKTEVLRSTSEVEAQHTEQCPKIHAEATCLAPSAFQLPAPLPRALPDAGPDRAVPAAPARETLALRRDRPSQHPVRAPPAR